MRTLHVPTVPERRLSADTHPVKVDVRPFALEGQLVLPSGAKAAIVFGNSAPSWQSDPSTAHLVAMLHDSGLAVLLLDLLTPRGGDFRSESTSFETALLAARIIAATDWLGVHVQLSGRPVGCLAFGAAGSAAVVAASERPSSLRAVVVVDPRLGAAEPVLPSLTSPLLMITGKRDAAGSLSAQRAMRTVGGRQVQSRSIPGGAGDLSRARVVEIASLAQPWFDRYLR